MLPKPLVKCLRAIVYSPLIMRLTPYRLIICIGMERVEYEDETTCMDGEGITGKVDWHLYK